MFWIETSSIVAKMRDMLGPPIRNLTLLDIDREMMQVEGLLSTERMSKTKGRFQRASGDGVPHIAIRTRRLVRDPAADVVDGLLADKVVVRLLGKREANLRNRHKNDLRGNSRGFDFFNKKLIPLEKQKRHGRS